MPDGLESPRWGKWQRFRRWLRRRRFIVADDSMVPALVPGDCLYVDPAAYRDRPPIRGEIVVTRDPALPSRHLVKRVAFVAGEVVPPHGAKLAPGMVYLLGDAPEESRDSREFGPVPVELLVGQVYQCYRPLEHRRDL